MSTPKTDHSTRPDARIDRVPDSDVYVLGAGPLGTALARRLQADDRNVVLVDESLDSTYPSDPTDVAALAQLELGRDAVVIVASSSDSRNLLVAQLVRTRFDVERVLVLTNDPSRVEAIADSGHEPVCATTALAEVLVDRV